MRAFASKPTARPEAPGVMVATIFCDGLPVDVGKVRGSEPPVPVRAPYRIQVVLDGDARPAGAALVRACPRFFPRGGRRRRPRTWERAGGSPPRRPTPRERATTIPAFPPRGKRLPVPGLDNRRVALLSLQGQVPAATAISAPGARGRCGRL